MNEVARQDIARISERALQLADAAGIFPTPLEAVRHVSGITELIDISGLPNDIAVRHPKFLKRLLGAYVFRSETAFVDLSQPDGRARFTEAHEIGHKIIPWHREAFYTDDDTHLIPSTRELLEQEANYAAARLLFQGHRFHERALQYETSIKTPVRLAPDLGASFHATIWYYVEHHPDPLALITTGRYGNALPVWGYVYSPTFRAQYSGLEEVFPGQWLPLTERSSYAEVASAALGPAGFGEVTFDIQDSESRTHLFKLEAFSNQYALFLMLSPKTRLRSGRRLRLVTVAH